MHNNSANYPAFNGHALVTIPRYINPVLEPSQMTPSSEMMSPLPTANREANSKTWPKNPHVAITHTQHMIVRDQSRPKMNQVESVNNFNGGQVAKDLPRVIEAKSQRNWTTGLFSCFHDWSSCLLGSLFPCCLAMTISCSLNECCCTANCYPVATRTKIRTEYNIVGTICEDAYILCWCYQCALCQMAREIDASSSDNYSE